jgi:hypothetical protein
MLRSEMGMIVRVVRSIPLLTELVPVRDGFHYRHGAPNGALTCFTASRTPKNPYWEFGRFRPPTEPDARQKAALARLLRVNHVEIT